MLTSLLTYLSKVTFPGVNVSFACQPFSFWSPPLFFLLQLPPSFVLTIFFGSCRICHCEGDEESPLITPCHCTGSLRFVHQACLQQWIKSSDTRCCELCKYEFIMETKLKPLRKVRHSLCVRVHICLCCTKCPNLAHVTPPMWSRKCQKLPPICHTDNMTPIVSTVLISGTCWAEGGRDGTLPLKALINRCGLEIAGH